jgi:putative ABC transport system permease protein
VLTMEMSLNGDRFQKTAGVAQLVENGRARLNAIPGVEDSAYTCCLPIEGEFGLAFAIVGKPEPAPQDLPSGGWSEVSAGYFDVFRIPILRGRAINEQDVAGSIPVVVVNQALQKKYFPKEDPIGQQIAIGKQDGPLIEEGPRLIVGIVGDTHEGGLDQEPLPRMFVPQPQVKDELTTLSTEIVPQRWVVRTYGDPHALIGPITDQLRQASGGFPVAQVRTMDEVVARSTARQDFNMLLLTIFGAVALALAAIGIYALMAYSVEQRTQEIGIRMALGADRATIRNLVVWQGMKLAMVGVALGVGAAFGLTRLMASFLFGVKTWDPTVFVTAPLFLSGVALFAVWLPAARAARLDPNQALRME